MGSQNAPPGFILAGGRSSRMGSNKALLTLGTKSVLAHVVERLSPQVSEIAINAPAAFPGFETLDYIEDRASGQLGPLAGILTGMRHHATRAPDISHFLTVPCDSPFLPMDLAARLTAAADGPQTIVIASSLGRRHPVFGLWPVTLADDLEQWLIGDDNRRINAFLDHQRTVTVDFVPSETEAGRLDPFLNINTPEDLAHAQAFAETLA
jgi:molybdopterin-guanine dinucleotide biosynthesis protein A